MIVLDILFPEMSGIKLLKDIRENGKDQCPISGRLLFYPDLYSSVFVTTDFCLI